MLVVSDVETSHFIYTANQMTGFHMKYNNGHKQVNGNVETESFKQHLLHAHHYQSNDGPIMITVN